MKTSSCQVDGRKYNIEKKDLAEEYLTKAKGNAIRFKNGNFPNMPLYQESDIKAAFNAGRCQDDAVCLLQPSCLSPLPEENQSV